MIPFGQTVRLVHAESATHEAMADELVRVMDALDAYLSQFGLWLDHDETRKKVRESKIVLPIFHGLQAHTKLVDRLLLEDWVRKDALYKAYRRLERTIEGLGIQV